MPSLYGRAAEYATQVVARAWAALPVSLAAVRQQADEGGSAMDVAAEGDEAAKQGGAPAEGDGAVQSRTVGVGVGGSTDGATSAIVRRGNGAQRRYHGGLTGNARRALKRNQRREAEARDG